MGAGLLFSWPGITLQAALPSAARSLDKDSREMVTIKRRRVWLTLWTALVTAAVAAAPACLPACASHHPLLPGSVTRSGSCPMQRRTELCCRQSWEESRPAGSICSRTSAGSCGCRMAVLPAVPVALNQEAGAAQTDLLAVLPAAPSTDRELLPVGECRPDPPHPPRASAHRSSPPRAPPMSFRMGRA
jgi:hypothetical protein